MIKEEKCDLFSKKDEYWLAHCISADFALGKGIALQFNEHFNMKNKLLNEFSFKWDNEGYCLIAENTPVFNLVTKKRCWNKPTYETLRQALVSMKEKMIELNVKKVAMPLIGCGLDKLEWDKVKTMIEEIFDDNVEIIVCFYSEKIEQ